MALGAQPDSQQRQGLWSPNPGGLLHGSEIPRCAEPCLSRNVHGLNYGAPSRTPQPWQGAFDWQRQPQSGQCTSAQRTAASHDSANTYHARWPLAFLFHRAHRYQ